MDDAAGKWPWLRFGEPYWERAAEDFLKRELRALMTRTLEFGPNLGSIDELLEALRNAMVLQRELGNVMLLIVAEARASGASWTSIGRALGVGRTAAHKRFGSALTRASEVAAMDVDRAIADAMQSMQLITFSEPEEIDRAEELLRRYGRDRVYQRTDPSANER